MLFNSYIFLFTFLPIVLAGYEALALVGRRAVVVWLLLSSLVFYAYWQPAYVILLCISIVFNYLAGFLISRNIPRMLPQRTVLNVAVVGNLLLLIYFKYLFPLLSLIYPRRGGGEGWPHILLPLGISFFTFTQIAFLVDLEQEAAQLQDLASYGLFVTFFPHLIAGPILHHSEMMPQFQKKRSFRLRADDVAIGVSLFTMGLFKKVLLADRFAPAADRVFASPATFHASHAWFGVLSYSLQLYFDFSGYSDMAIGIARMLSVQFPLNFDSPYKSENIIDFWQRWHMTLTRYIMSYLYNPISMIIYRQRVARGKKTTRKALTTVDGFIGMIAFPTTIALFLAGIWHGAGIQFMVFGLLHAMYLSLNHAWRLWNTTIQSVRWHQLREGRPFRIAGTLLTFCSVLLAQVFFRSSSVSSSSSLLAALLGFHRDIPELKGMLRLENTSIVFLVIGYIIVWFAPNTQQILGRFTPALNVSAKPSNKSRSVWSWQPTAIWAACLGVILVLTLVKMQDPSTFLYFQF